LPLVARISLNTWTVSVYCFPIFVYSVSIQIDPGIGLPISRLPYWLSGPYFSYHYGRQDIMTLTADVLRATFIIHTLNFCFLS
jgi:hypothetical protein